MITRAVLFLAALFASTQALACTFCLSQTAREVRARLFENDFLANLAMISLPALVLMGAVFYAAQIAVREGGAR